MRSLLISAIAITFASTAGTVARAPVAPKTHTVNIVEMRFQPESLTVAPGDFVVWINKDIVPHTATAAGSFDSKTIEPTRSWSYRARRKGEMAYVCTLHPTMKGTLRIK